MVLLAGFLTTAAAFAAGVGAHPTDTGGPLRDVSALLELSARESANTTTSTSPQMTGAGGWESAFTRARDVVSQLTLAEKANLTGGIGSIGRCEGTLGRVDRFEIPELCFQDGPTGLRGAGDGVTVFPAGMTTAATFNRTLFYQRGAAMAQEFRGKGVNVLLGPVTGGPLGRSPYQGRNWEGFGADPYLIGEAAYATVTGIQSQGVIATSKHYLAYEQETFRQLYAADDIWTLNPINNTQNTYDAQLDDRTLHELYLKPFMNAVRAGTGAIMCVYNQINGTQGCENSKVLSSILKDELGFQGFVLSDWSAVFNTTPAVNAGVDVTMPGGATTGGYRNLVTGQALIDAVSSGAVAESRVNDAVTRLLTQYYLRKQDDGTYPHVSYKDGYQESYLNGTLVNEHIDVQADHKDVSRVIAEDAVTLIFNRGEKNGTGQLGLPRAGRGTGLPLRKDARVGVFGSDAGTSPYGINGCRGWIGPGSNLCAGNHTSNGTNAMGWGSGAGYFPYLVDPLTVISKVARENGGSIESNLLDTELEGGAGTNGALVRTLAAITDVALVFVQARSGEDSDRTSLELEANGTQLIQAVASVSNNTIVIVHTVGPVFIDEVFNHPNITALVFPHLPGQESGTSLGSVLYGDVNPSGKMPYSLLARNDSQYYPDIMRTMQPDGTIPVPFSEGLFVDYKKFDREGVKPLIHFGHGVSYTTFEHGKQLVAQAVSDSSSYPTEVPVDEESGTQTNSSNSNAPGGANALWEYVVQLQTTLKNTGDIAGKEVSQLYVQLPDSAPSGTPRKQLVSFDKVALQPGEEKQVEFKVTRRDLSYWDVTRQQFVVPDGTFVFYEGASSADDELKVSVKVGIKNGSVQS